MFLACGTWNCDSKHFFLDNIWLFLTATEKHLFATLDFFGGRGVKGYQKALFLDVIIVSIFIIMYF